MADDLTPLDIRPHELALLVAGADSPAIAALRRAIATHPAQPLTLRCPVQSAYAYQNPATADPSPLLLRADLLLLQRLGLAPGDTRPAIDLLERLLERVTTLRDILWFETATGEAWGLGLDAARAYEAGRARGLGAWIPPRDPAEMARLKAASAAAMLAADTLEIRPHHLMCMACFFGNHSPLAPIAEDNLYEAIIAIQQRPDVPVRLVRGPCMICPPCPRYDAATRRCLGGSGMALRDEWKDLEVLRRLGMCYGDVMPGAALFRRLFAAVPTTRDVCGYGEGVCRAPEWRVCGEADGSSAYERARAAGLGLATGI